MANKQAEPSLFIIFGSTGDLSRRKLLPAIGRLAAGRSLPENFHVLGVARDIASDAATRSPLPPFHRVSLSLRTINAARRVIFLVLGDHKAIPVARVMDQLGQKDASLPAAMVNPGRGALHWFLDYAAAAQLDRSHPIQPS